MASDNSWGLQSSYHVPPVAPEHTYVVSVLTVLDLPHVGNACIYGHFGHYTHYSTYVLRVPELCFLHSEPTPWRTTQHRCCHLSMKSPSQKPGRWPQDIGPSRLTHSDPSPRLALAHGRVGITEPDSCRCLVWVARVLPILHKHSPKGQGALCRKGLPPSIHSTHSH